MSYSTLTFKATNSVLTKMYKYKGIENDKGERVYCKSGFTLGGGIVGDV